MRTTYALTVLTLVLLASAFPAFVEYTAAVFVLILAGLFAVLLLLTQPPPRKSLPHLHCAQAQV